MEFMESVRFTKWDKRLEFSNTPRPKIAQPDEVLIKIIFSGVSRLDVSIINGNVACNKNEGFVLGHEICGIITDIGSDVMTFKKKDRVVIDPYTNCGICTCCRSGKPHLCHMGCAHSTLGIYTDGGWADYIVVPQAQVYKLPQGLTLEQAIVTEPMSYISHGWNVISPIYVTQKILVMGAGLVGLLWIIMLHYHGHRKVTVSEPNLARHEFIQQLDIKFEILSPKLLMERQEDDPDFLFDVVIDCSGIAKTVEQAIHLLEYGGKLCIVSITKPDAKISVLPIDIQKNEKMIVGINRGSFDFPRALSDLECLGDRYISFHNLGIKTYPLEDYKSAIDHVKKGSVLKAVFRMPDDCKCSRYKEKI